MTQELNSREVCNIVIEKLKTQIPYFVMRMGDGDMVMSQPSRAECKAKFQNKYGNNRKIEYYQVPAEEAFTTDSAPRRGVINMQCKK